MKILKFYTDTCMPCRMVGKVLENIDHDKIKYDAQAFEGAEALPENNK